jgi:hypothetical protein
LWQLAQDAALTSAPASVAVKFGQIDMFGRGTDSGVWQGIAVAALPARQCSASNPSISLGQIMTDLLEGLLPVHFVNTSSTACYLVGSPGATALDSAGNPIGMPISEVGSGNDPVPLLPGGSAAAWVSWVYPGESTICRPSGVLAQAEISIIPRSTAPTVLLLPSEPAKFVVCASGDNANWGMSDVFSPTVFPLPS